VNPRYAQQETIMAKRFSVSFEAPGWTIVEDRGVEEGAAPPKVVELTFRSIIRAQAVARLMNEEHEATD
jgi:hypothetical protein